VTCGCRPRTDADAPAVVAKVALDLQRARLAEANIGFVKDKQPMTITVAITDKGRKALVDAS
jgi:hypothetical protein